MLLDMWRGIDKVTLEKGDTISCNGTERNGTKRNETERNETKRNETKRNDFDSCFSNYYRDITILRNETIPFCFVPFRF
jgi:hypothetical protein